MITVRPALVSALLLFASAAPAFAADVTGELVDQTCYVKDKHKNAGVGHQDCATLCALKGQTLAVVTDNGEVLAITGELTANKHAQLVPHMSHRVTVKGEITDKDGAKVINGTEIRMAAKR
jgi:hypothetical protein